MRALKQSQHSRGSTATTYPRPGVYRRIRCALFLRFYLACACRFELLFCAWLSTPSGERILKCLNACLITKTDGCAVEAFITHLLPYMHGAQSCQPDMQDRFKLLLRLATTKQAMHFNMLILLPFAPLFCYHTIFKSRSIAIQSPFANRMTLIQADVLFV